MSEAAFGVDGEVSFAEAVGEAGEMACAEAPGEPREMAWGCSRRCKPCRGAACPRYGRAAEGRLASSCGDGSAGAGGEPARAGGKMGGLHGGVPRAGGRLTCESVKADSPVDVVRETIDAVTGATWTTRNLIMEDLFRRDLARNPESMPAFKPPGT